MPRFAAIDVGSNALRLRLIEASAPSEGPKADAAGIVAPDPWKDLATVRAPVRLGSEVFSSGRLAPASIGQARERLLEEVIDRALGEALPQVGTVEVLVGTGGNVDTLCDLCPAKGPTRAIDVATAKATFKKMCGMSNSERRDAFQLRPDRAD